MVAEVIGVQGVVHVVARLAGEKGGIEDKRCIVITENDMDW
jgi:hypothetical protein